jgi:hypothetical protein
MLWKTIANSQQVYSRYINEYTFPQVLGHVEWNQCFATNTTYLDCPTKNMGKDETSELLVSVYNPSKTYSYQTTSIKVPSGTYKFQSVDGKDIDSELYCQNALQIDGSTVRDCDLHLANLGGHGLKAYKLLKTASAEASVP